MNIYSWQNDLWRQMAGTRGRMAHAILLQGRMGIGKQDFAVALARSLLCDQPLSDAHACGVCNSCNWYTQGNHPDLRILEPEDNAGNVADEDGAVANGMLAGHGALPSAEPAERLQRLAALARGDDELLAVLERGTPAALPALLECRSMFATEYRDYLHRFGDRTMASTMVLSETRPSLSRRRGLNAS